ARGAGGRRKGGRGGAGARLRGRGGGRPRRRGLARKRERERATAAAAPHSPGARRARDLGADGAEQVVERLGRGHEPRDEVVGVGAQGARRRRLLLEAREEAVDVGRLRLRDPAPAVVDGGERLETRAGALEEREEPAAPVRGIAAPFREARRLGVLRAEHALAHALERDDERDRRLAALAVAQAAGEDVGDRLAEVLLDRGEGRARLPQP